MFEDVTLETKIIEKIEKSDKYKTEFLSNMSHEIRSPINSIVGFAELLKDVKNDKEKINQYINIIQKSSESLTKIVNDILDITKIEEGKLEINKTNFNLNQFLEEMILTNKNKIKNNKIELKLNIQKSDVIITCDSFRLRQIINNLISNATKFTDNGYIELGYIKTDNFIEFFVKDTGLGIKEEEQLKIFDRYSQALYNNKKTLGHGLGLSISKELVNLMGGEIRLESEYGKGSTFYFTIPNNKTLKRLKN
jgi:signal transduction histidine kinase